MRGRRVGGGSLFGGMMNYMREVERQEQEARSRREARETEKLIETLLDPNAFRSGGIGDWSHVEASKTLNFDGRGWYIGILWVGEEGHPLYYDGQQPISIEGVPGVGKGVSIATNIAHLAGQASLVVVDYDNEGYNTGAEHWRSVCGPDSVVQIDLERPECGQVNPLAEAIRLANTGQISKLLKELEKVVTTLLPDPDKTGDNQWILIAARELAELILYIFARYAPDFCYLPYLQEICGRTFKDTLATLHSLVGDDVDDQHVMDKLSKFEEAYKDEPKHGTWYLQEITAVTRYFDKQTELGQVLLGDSIDYSSLKTRSTFVSIGADKDNIKQAARAIALISRGITESAAASKGPLRCYVVFDEAPEYKIDLPTWCRTLRKMNVVPVIATQNEAAMEHRYGEKVARDIFGTCGLRVWLSVSEDRVAKDLETRSGTSPSVVRTLSSNRGPVEQGSQSTSTQREPNLKVADLLKLNAQEQRMQIAAVSGHPLFVLGWEPWWEIEPWCDQLKTYDEQNL